MQDFQYQPFVNPYAASMADEIARSGDAHAHAAEIIGRAQARAAELKGAGWGHAIQTIGNLPTTIANTQAAQTDRKLKEQELSMTIEQRQQVQAQRVATMTGRIFGVSRTPEEAAAALDQATQSGLLPPEIGQHVKAQIASWGGDPAKFRSGRQQYIDFADQFSAPMKLGEGESLVRPSVGGGAPVVAEGSKKPVKLGPGEQLIPEGGGAPLATAPFAPGTGQHVVNGAVVDASGAQVGDTVPKQETPSEVAQRQAQTLKLTRETSEIDQKLAGTTPISPKDRQELEIRRAQIQLETARNDRMERKEDVSNPRYQGQLEKQYRDLASKVISSRAGQLGVEDGKVGQAKHLIAMFNQFTDPKTGAMTIPPAQHMELAVGLATLISPKGTPTEGMVKQLEQATAQGDLAKMGTYLTGHPFGGTPQQIAKLLRDSVERQGLQAEDNREKELDAIRSFRPTDLAEERAVGIERGLGGLNRMKDVGVGGAPKEGTEGTVGGVPAIWKTVDGKAGWYAK
jgi:hypothetical protein